MHGKPVQGWERGLVGPVPTRSWERQQGRFDHSAAQQSSRRSRNPAIGLRTVKG